MGNQHQGAYRFQWRDRPLPEVREGAVLKYRVSEQKNQEKPGLYRPCAMCAKLERALHDAIKTIERLQKTLEGYEKERENVKP